MNVILIWQVSFIMHRCFTNPITPIFWVPALFPTTLIDFEFYCSRNIPSNGKNIKVRGQHKIACLCRLLTYNIPWIDKLVSFEYLWGLIDQADQRGMEKFKKRGHWKTSRYSKGGFKKGGCDPCPRWACKDL